MDSNSTQGQAASVPALWRVHGPEHSGTRRTCSGSMQDRQESGGQGATRRSQVVDGLEKPLYGLTWKSNRWSRMASGDSTWNW